MLSKLCAFFILCGSAFALETKDQAAIESIIHDYTDSWNLRGCKGFADGFSENADFVNIFGMTFSGREEIEQRHVEIVKTFFKGSTLEILNTKLREVQPGLVVANIRWKLDGFRKPGSDASVPGETKEGIYTQVFVHTDGKWEITASQNTVAQK